SCSPAAVSSGENSGSKTGEELTTEEIEELAEALEEEVVAAVDFESAQLGAELSGYMPSYLCSNADNYVAIEVTNTSDFTWRVSGTNTVRIGYHFYGQDVDFVEYDKTARSVLPNDLEPGETARVEVLINDIINPGIYVVQIDIEVKGYAWLSSLDVPMVEGRVYFEDCGDDQRED
ncbi:MAG: hypothetical protein MUP02_05645, partial [Actinobacteria bacterium]|nr:hypothetical protein [Actinomycetota bacterium]